MQRIAAILLLLLASPLWANMASPYAEGSEIGTTFLNRHAKVLYEKLTIRPDATFEQATVEAVYNIYLDSTGIDIPLLFVARDYLGDFRVFVDGKRTEAIPLSQSSIGFLKRLPYGWEKVLDSAATDHSSLTISWSSWNQAELGMDDLLYFETPLDSAYHNIKVRYEAKTWVDHSDWIKQTSLSYSLSPAKYWQDFGELELILDNSNFVKNLRLRSIGEPQEGSIENIAIWRFDKLPTDVLVFEHTPKVSRWANLLMGIGPLGISLICILPFVLIRFLLLSRFRKRKPKKFNPWILIGGLVVPIIWGIIMLNSYSWIDAAIGEAAGGMQGYMIALGLLILVPILIVAYSLLGVAADVFLKRKR
jgi:hypothetical protein